MSFWPFLNMRNRCKTAASRHSGPRKSKPDRRVIPGNNETKREEKAQKCKTRRSGGPAKRSLVNKKQGLDNLLIHQNPSLCKLILATGSHVLFSPSPVGNPTPFLRGINHVYQYSSRESLLPSPFCYAADEDPCQMACLEEQLPRHP